MPELGPWELLIIAAVVMVLFGSKKLPGAAKSLGQSMRIFKTEVKGLRDEDDAPRAAGPQELAAPVQQPAPVQYAAPVQQPAPVQYAAPVQQPAAPQYAPPAPQAPSVQAPPVQQAPVEQHPEQR